MGVVSCRTPWEPGCKTVEGLPIFLFISARRRLICSKMFCEARPLFMGGDIDIRHSAVEALSPTAPYSLHAAPGRVAPRRAAPGASLNKVFVSRADGRKPVWTHVVIERYDELKQRLENDFQILVFEPQHIRFRIESDNTPNGRIWRPSGYPEKCSHIGLPHFGNLQFGNSQCPSWINSCHRKL